MKLTAGVNILPKLNYQEALEFVYQIVTDSLKSEVQIQDFQEWFDELAKEERIVGGKTEKVIQLDP